MRCGVRWPMLGEELGTRGIDLGGREASSSGSMNRYVHLDACECEVDGIVERVHVASVAL